MNCQEIASLNNYAKAQLRVSESQFFFIGIDPTSPFHLHFLKLTYGNSSPDRANKMLCASGTCTVLNSESILSSDSTYIYTTFTYGSTTQYMYLTTLKSSDGTVVGSRYRTSISIEGILGLTQQGDYLAWTSFYSTTYILTLWNTITFEFTHKQFSGSYLYQVIVEATSGRYLN